MSAAKFPLYRDLNSFEFAESPVNEQQIRKLYSGEFTSEPRNIVLVGGTGKTHLGIARRTRREVAQARALLQRGRSGQSARTGEER